jgi:tetratricopeptide (TPR) repeat protein
MYQKKSPFHCFRHLFSTVFILTLFTFFKPNLGFAQNAYNKACLEALEFESVGNLDAAVSKYSEAIKINPDEWTGYSYRGKINIYKGEYEDAKTDFSKAISVSPQTLTLYGYRANCFEAQRIYDKAIEDYSIALSKVSYSDKEIYLTYFQRGRTYYNFGKFPEAIRDFNLALGLAETFQKPTAEIYKFRALSNLELGKFPEAGKDFESFLILKPNDSRALFYQGYIFLRNGETDKAEVNALKILSIEPAKQVYFSGDHLMDLYNLEMRRKKASAQLEFARVMLSPQQHVSSATISNLTLKNAFSVLDSAWVYSPELNSDDLVSRDSIRKQMFLVYPMMKDKPEISEFAELFMDQAKTAGDEKKYDLAIGLWSRALSVTPCLPQAYFNRALLWEQKQNYRNSISDMEIYLLLMPGSSDASHSKDKINEWKTKNVGQAVVTNSVNTSPPGTSGPINQMVVKEKNPGLYMISFAVGGSFGIQTKKNPSLSELWSQSTPSLDFHYTDRKTTVLYSGDMELVIRPLKWLGIGGFGKLLGGVGARTTEGGTKYIMNIGTGQYGGLVRGYLVQGNAGKKPDLFLQYGYGKTSIIGYSAVATMDGAIFDYSYTNDYKGSAPYNSFGMGIGGRIGKFGYSSLSLDYISSNIEEINYEITMNLADPALVGQKGILKNTVTGDNITANYNGIVLKILYGMCF